jgi:hypothetical protein
MTVEILLPPNYGPGRTALRFDSYEDAELIGEHIVRTARRLRAEAAQAQAPFRFTRPKAWRHGDPDEVRDEIVSGDRPAPLGWQGQP